MPFITFAERHGMEKGVEKGIEKGRMDGLEAVIEVRFPEAMAELLPLLRRVQNGEKLLHLLSVVKKAELTEFRQALDAALAGPQHS